MMVPTVHVLGPTVHMVVPTVYASFTQPLQKENGVHLLKIYL